MAQRKPKALVVPEYAHGVCIWEVDGQFIADADNNFLCMEGVVGDRRIEAKMREAAHYWLGEAIGEPHWVRGARMVTSDELDDQMQRLMDGKIPDPIEQMRQAQKGN